MTRIRVTPSSLDPRKPYKFVTVSPHPDMARLMVKKFAEIIGDEYIVIHAANCERKDPFTPTELRSEEHNTKKSQTSKKSNSGSGTCNPIYW